MEEADFAAIKNKIAGGVLALTTRTFILQIISFAATFILTILLSPSVFGVFFVVSAVISFLSYFSDIGLAAALIQKKENPTDEELVTVFTIQQILVGGIVILFFLFAPSIASFYQLGKDGFFLMRALLVSFFLSSLKTIPSVLLERKLEFKLLIVPQILETGGFYLVAIILAFLGKGIESFAWAAITRGFIGLIAIYLICPWWIRIGISGKVLASLLSFGLPFQANSILALIKDDLMTIFLGKVLPFSQVGYIGWAKKWAEAPLRLIMDSVIRVTFPAYARLQEDKVTLGKAISKSIFFLALFIFPITSFLVIYIQPMIHLIPKYIKWEPAVFSFYLFAFSAVAAAFSSPLVNALNAIGKIKMTLGLMVFWTLLTWLSVPIFIVLFGYNGVALVAFFISFTAFIPIILIRRFIYFPILTSLYKPAVTTLIMNILIYLIVRSNQSLAVVATSLFLGMVFYAVIIWLWMKEEILPYLPKFFKLN